jgi:hypothetical protein
VCMCMCMCVGLYSGVGSSTYEGKRGVLGGKGIFNCLCVCLCLYVKNEVTYLDFFRKICIAICLMNDYFCF